MQDIRPQSSLTIFSWPKQQHLVNDWWRSTRQSRKADSILSYLIEPTTRPECSSLSPDVDGHCRYERPSESLTEAPQIARMPERSEHRTWQSFRNESTSYDSLSVYLYSRISHHPHVPHSSTTSLDRLGPPYLLSSYLYVPTNRSFAKFTARQKLQNPWQTCGMTLFRRASFYLPSLRTKTESKATAAGSSPHQQSLGDVH